ncbi:NHL repeat-containing protein [Mycolicibacterium sp.]|uniref:NHL repeat-containing protein n=1 Tax=Mycolicibacterium sp. TaxID=2320850 RepID=UPI001A18E23C|nr:NHL repeat-containing protein [Mycolicibacterium sp.]MBJ7339448.1 NHL repeat-containing protein [Mycolicibacterium sp.]
MNVSGRPARVDVAPDVDLSGGWAPELWLGAPAPGGLALPPASPTMAWMYSPRGVFLGDHHVVVADSGNHRVLIWHGMPTADEQPADVVLGQPDGVTEGRAANGRGPERGMNLPTGVLVHDGRLIVADAWHHRILVWDDVPVLDDTPPDHVLGQPDPSSVLPNQGGECSASTFYWPFGIAVVGSRFWVADTGNRRVLGWDGGIPTRGRPADIVLGQPDASHREENRGGDAGPASFRWPHDIAGREDLLLIADAGDHRVLGWSPQPDADRPADVVIGQSDFTTSTEWPYGPHTGDRFRFPYAIGLDGDGSGERLAIADTANNRILLWDGVPTDGRAADYVLAQPDLGSNGENRWTSVQRDTLCWPYGISLRGDRLAVSDSGNNRVVIWRREGP